MPYVGIGSIQPLLRSLAWQTLETDRWELVLVDQSGGELDLSGIADVPVRRIAVRRDPSFRGHTAPLLRNEGARQARGRWLVFIDADCITDRDCLRNHFALQAAAPDTLLAVCGGMRELPAERLDLVNGGPHRYDVIRRASLPDYRAGRPGGPARWDDFYSLNVSVSGALFQAVRGFDETGFRCHDIELGYRLAQHGARFTFAPQCEVIHVEHPRVAASRLEQAAAWRRLGEAFPETRAIANDRVLIAQRAYERIVQAADRAFAALTHGLPGRRAGSVWICPAATDPAVIESLLRSVPFVRRECRSTLQFFLRLERNCWDYSITVPSAESPRLTIAIPAYNAARTIDRTIRSIFAQTLQELEIVVIDDASTDDTAAVAREWAFDGRLRVISLQHNGGPAVALNRALDAASAPYLMHVDADDWLERTAVETVIDAFETDGALAAVYANPIVHSADGATAYLRPTSATGAAEIFAQTVPQVPRTYRVAALNAAGGWPIDDPAGGRYYEDRLMLARMLRHGGVRHIEEWLYNIKRSDRSVSMNPDAPLAKFAILSSAANRLGRSVSVKRRQQFLEAEIVGRRSMAAGEWSVIIPIHNRADLFALTLRSWLESDWAGSGSELIVVDDGSDAPPSLPDAGDRIHLIRGDVARGPAWARNAGASAANRPMLLFADSDHIVPRDILGVHRWYHEQDSAPAIVVGGVYGRRVFSRCHPRVVARGRLDRFLSVIANHERFPEIAACVARDEEIVLADGDTRDVWEALAPFTFADSQALGWSDLVLRYGRDLKEYPHAWLRVGGANTSMAASTFASLGEFDERLHSAEDWDMGVRAQRAGVRIVAALEAETWHQVHARTRSDAVELDARRLFAERHPEMVDALLRAELRERAPGSEEFFIAGNEIRAAQTRREESAPPLVAITFDDGPNPVGTRVVLDALRRHGARATFFVTGRNAAMHPRLLQRLAAEGHEIGVHGWHHTDPLDLITPELLNDFRRTMRVVRHYTGVTPAWMRPAYGHLSPSVMAAAQLAGLQPVLWHVSSGDWSQDGWRTHVRRLAVEGVRGRVVLMHDASIEPDDMGRTLEWLLDTAAGGGLRLVTISQYQELAKLPLSVREDGSAGASKGTHGVKVD